MKKLLVLLCLIAMIGTVSAYQTVVTFTITGITTTGGPATSIGIGSSTISNDCAYGNAVPISIIHVGQSQSFMCSVVSGAGYSVNINGSYDFEFPYVAP